VYIFLQDLSKREHYWRPADFAYEITDIENFAFDA
jgi:hypothetical protein